VNPIDRVAGVHPKMIAAQLRSDAKADRNPLAETDWRRPDRPDDRTRADPRGLTKQEISHAMGYQDQSAVSRWIAGVERPLLDKLLASMGFTTRG
jgi:hypothetical protein